MSDAISYASAGRSFLSPRSAQKSVSTRFRQRQALSVSLRRCRFPRLPTFAKHILRASLCLHSFTITDTFSASSPIPLTFQNT